MVGTVAFADLADAMSAQGIWVLQVGNTVEVLDKETLDKESRVSRPMDGWSWATHLASKQDRMRQGLAPLEGLP